MLAGGPGVENLAKSGQNGTFFDVFFKPQFQTGAYFAPDARNSGQGPNFTQLANWTKIKQVSITETAQLSVTELPTTFGENGHFETKMAVFSIPACGRNALLGFTYVTALLPRPEPKSG